MKQSDKIDGRPLRIGCLGVVALVALFAGLLWFAPQWTFRQLSGEPGEEKLVTAFARDRERIEILAAMAEADGFAHGFCARGRGLEHARGLLGNTRVDEYLARLAELRLECIGRSDKGEVQLTVWATGFPGTHIARGYELGAAAPGLPEASCLDRRECYEASCPAQRVFHTHHRSIADGWSLFLFHR